MRLQLKNTPEQVELIRAMGSKDPAVAREASEAFAAFLGPVVQEVIYQAATASSIFVDAPYDEDDSPSYPLDLYYNEGAGYVTVWSQNMAGGLPTSHVEGLSEMKISTYRLDSAVSFNKRYARKARLDVVSKAVERMAQEVLVKQERNAWAVVLKGLAEASTDVDGTAFQHVVREAGKTIFTLGGLNDLVVRMKRVNDSFAGGTPADAYSRGLTDLYVSPEVKGDIRSFAYNAVGGETNNAGRTATDLPDSERAKIYAGGGTQEIFGINITEWALARSTTLCLVLLLSAVVTLNTIILAKLPLLLALTKFWLVSITVRVHLFVLSLVMQILEVLSKLSLTSNLRLIAWINKASMAPWKRAV